MPVAARSGSAELELPPTKGRFRANKFMDGRIRSRKFPFSDSVALRRSTPDSAAEAVRWQLRLEGFEVVQVEGPSRQAHLLSHSESTLGGLLVGERGLRLDRGRSKRLDRSHWVSLAVGLPLFGVGMSNLLIGTPHIPLPLVANLGLLALGSLLFTYGWVNFSSLDFWSDLVLVEYVGPYGPGPKSDDPGERVSDLAVTISVGRACTENWESKVEKGRAVEVILDDPHLHRVATSLRDRLSSESALP
ncbi:MAG: hypothetical protein L3K18_01360 [Thermoplasmata archaeon]|nr:hypothetical protein [Thermoplasmata archaeon]